MSKTILFFVKIFSEKAHARDFLSGILYSNRLSFFRQFEEDAQANRGDRHEATVAWHQHEQVELTLNDHKFTDLISPVSLQVCYQNDPNLFCVYAAHTGTFTEITNENIFELREHLRIPRDCLELGEYAVVVTHAKTFIDRVRNTVRNNGFALRAGLVEYYDPCVFSGSFSKDEAIFRKRTKFEHQREYRFCFDTGSSGHDPLKLKVEDTSDIAVLCRTDEVNSMLQVRLPDGSIA